MYIRNVS